MDGIHDLGGKHGYGAVEREVNEPVFHAAWEAKVFSFLGAARRSGSVRNVDQFRHAIERIDPRAYLTHGYYGRWLGGLETLLVEAGVLETAEIEKRVAARSSGSSALVAARPRRTPDRVGYDAGSPHAARGVSSAPRFRAGDRVRTRPHGERGHTRLPQYARGREGTVTAHHGGWVFPDRNAHGDGEAPEHLYTVAFDARTLWGDDTEPGVVVHLDLFEPYLARLEAPGNGDTPHRVGDEPSVFTSPHVRAGEGR